MALRDYLIGEIVEDCSDGLLTRREALRRLGLMGLGLGAATAVLAACGDDDEETAGGSGTSTSTSSAPSTTSTTAAAQPGETESETIRFAGPSGELQAAWAAPEDPKGAVLVIHENRGLTPHFHDLVARLAGEGYAALSVDLLSSEGGTASLSDPAAAPARLSAAPVQELLGDLRAGIGELQRRAPGEKAGAVGFCFGGGMTWSLLDAGETRLAAAVPFYGPAPADPDFSRARAAVLGIYAELDGDRVNGTRELAGAALTEAGLTHEIRTFAGADHAFFNDTGPRYNEAAATEAYAALLDWFDRYLA